MNSLPMSNMSEDLMCTVSRQRTACRVWPLADARCSIWCKIGMTPGEKFEGISVVPSLGPCIGSHLHEGVLSFGILIQKDVGGHTTCPLCRPFCSPNLTKHQVWQDHPIPLLPSHHPPTVHSFLVSFHRTRSLDPRSWVHPLKLGCSALNPVGSGAAPTCLGDDE